MPGGPGARRCVTSGAAPGFHSDRGAERGGGCGRTRPSPPAAGRAPPAREPGGWKGPRGRRGCAQLASGRSTCTCTCAEDRLPGGPAREYHPVLLGEQISEPQGHAVSGLMPFKNHTVKLHVAAKAFPFGHIWVLGIMISSPFKRAALLTAAAPSRCLHFRQRPTVRVHPKPIREAAGLRFPAASIQFALCSARNQRSTFPGANGGRPLSWAKPRPCWRAQGSACLHHLRSEATVPPGSLLPSSGGRGAARGQRWTWRV